MKNQGLLWYRIASLVMAVSFGAVGLIFFVFPEGTLEFFNRLSSPLGMPPSPIHSGSFFPILALAYMVMVTLLAGWMFRKPRDPLFPMLLAQAKFASSILSLVFFFGRSPYLICLANAVIDGGIGALALGLLFLQKKRAASWPTCP